MYYFQGSNDSINKVFFIRNHGGQKNMLQHFLRDERKDSINPEYYIQQNYTLRIKQKSRHLQMD